MLRVTLPRNHLLLRGNFCFAKVINFLPAGYRRVSAFGYTQCFKLTGKDKQVSENLITLYSNQQTLFGRGGINQLVPLLAENPQPTLLFCGRSFLNSAVWARLAPALNAQILGYEIVSHEASPDDIDGWVTRWRGHVDRVVAIGGGSVLDAAKAFSAMIQHPLNTARYLEKVGDTPVQAVTLPLIAIPTTAGTGSEVTQNAVVTDQQHIRVKASLRHPVFVPHIAILDPDLLSGAPDRVLATCGMDAFTHRFEACLSRRGKLFSRQQALSGHPEQQRLMAELGEQLFPGDPTPPALVLKAWLQQHAIVPFWQGGPTVSPEEVDWVVSRANSKNGWVEYDTSAMTAMMTAAWRIA